MKYRLVILLVTIFHYYTSAQTTERPKLVVGIVVDQMRAEYLYRFQENYSENGFKRLMREGFHVKNMHYNYVPTTTGAGHASIYTGTTPSEHGITANDWYSKEKNRMVYCAEDETVFLTDGSSNSKKVVSNYSRSPKILLAKTITDELKLFTNNRSKVVGISLKDRGAILPAGHLADYAFWYHSKTGDFVTSSYYSSTLPDWLQTFNNKRKADSLLNLTWETLKPIERYMNSGEDNTEMEKVFIGKTDATFPYNLKKLRKENGDFAMMPYVPFGNTLLTQMAKETIKGEHMGMSGETDFLTISYSATDYVGHSFGIRSKELEDTYVRMDAELADLLSFLDTEIGRDDYLLFLTADHAASDHPQFLKKSRLSGKFFNSDGIKVKLNTELSKRFGKANYVAHLDETHIYLNEVKTPKADILRASETILKSMDGIKEVYIPFLHDSRGLQIDSYFRRSFHAENSGDILLYFKQGWMPKRTEGTTHGTSYNNDTHVPMIWYGSNIPQGETIMNYSIDQIVPTLSMLLNIPLPSSSSRYPIIEVFEK